MSHLPQVISDLSAAEKFELLDTLWESLEADLSSITNEQREELECRVARYHKNPSNVIAWEQVKADLLKKR